MLEDDMKNDFLKGLLAGLVILYIVSPVDAVPGPIDDLILMLIMFVSWQKEPESSKLPFYLAGEF